MHYTHSFLEQLAVDAMSEDGVHTDQKSYIFYAQNGRIYEYSLDKNSQLWNATTIVVVFKNAEEGEHVLIADTHLSSLRTYPTIRSLELCTYENDPDTLFTLLFENCPILISGFLEDNIYYPSQRWTKSYEDFYDPHFRGSFPREVTYKFYVDSGEIITFETCREYTDDIRVMTMNVTHASSFHY